QFTVNEEGWHKVRIPLSTLDTHLYIAGKTGMGKSSRRTWNRELAAAPLMIESLLNKATALTLSPYLAPMLGASTCLSLREVMDRGQILLVNLRTPGEETRNLLGSLLMTSFEQAARSREILPKQQPRK